MGKATSNTAMLAACGLRLARQPMAHALRLRPMSIAAVHRARAPALAWCEQHGSPSLPQVRMFSDEAPKKKKKKKKKDPNAPKRGKSAYILFSSEHRARVKASNPDASAPEMLSLLGAEWQQLKSVSSAKSELDRFNQLAADDKARYEREMASYTPPPSE